MSDKKSATGVEMGRKEEIVYQVINLPYPKAYHKAQEAREGGFIGTDNLLFEGNDSYENDREWSGDERYEKWKKEQYELTQKLHDGDFIHVGQIVPKDIPEAVNKVMAEYIALVKEAMNVPGLSKQEQEIIGSRLFVTYDEYLEAFSNNEHLINKHWQNADNPARARFIANNKPTFQDYFSILEEKGLKIAAFFLRRLEIVLPEEDRKRHTYICAKTGSGKSELLKMLVYSYLRKPDYCSIVVIEPHGDLCEEIARFRENGRSAISSDYMDEEKREELKGPAHSVLKLFAKINNSGFHDRLVYIDPTLFDDYTPSINPFELKDKSEKNIDVLSQEMAGVFEELLKSSGLSLQMQTILIPCISVLLRMDYAIIKDLQIFMDDERNGHLVNLGKQSPNEAHREFFRNAFHNKAYAPTKQSIYTKIQSLLNSPGFANLIAKSSTIDLEAELDAKKLILFNLSKGKMGDDSSEAAGRFIVAMTQSIIKRRAWTHKSERVPVHMFIDECQNYVSPSIETVLTELRKYGLHLTLANQFIGQNMDTQFKAALLSSTNIKFMGMNNAASLSALAKETGADLEELQNLTTGEFIMKCGNRPALKIHVPGFLAGNKNSMPLEIWKETVKAQKARYYQPKNGTNEATENEQLREEINAGRPVRLPAVKSSKESGKAPKPKFDL